LNPKPRKTTIVKTISSSYQVRGLVSKEIRSSYQVRGLVSKSILSSFVIKTKRKFFETFYYILKFYNMLAAAILATIGIMCFFLGLIF